MYGSLNDSGLRILEFLANNSSKEHNLIEINKGVSYMVPSYEIEEILNVFHQLGYTTQLFIVDELLDVESRAENKYKITSKGELFYLEQNGLRKHGQQAIDDLEEEEDTPDAADQKRKNRNKMIAFALIILIAITTLVLVNL